MLQHLTEPHSLRAATVVQLYLAGARIGDDHELRSSGQVRRDFVLEVKPLVFG